MQSKFRETGEHIRQVEASIHSSPDRIKLHNIKLHQFTYSRVRQQDKVSSIKQASKEPITTMSMRETAIQQEPRQVILRHSRVSPCRCTLGWGVKLCKKAISVMRWTTSMK